MATRKRKAASRRPGTGARASVERSGEIAALNRSQAVIELALDGTVLAANDNFLQTMGYALKEIKGKHYDIFVDPAERVTVAYGQFWEKLAGGEFDTGQYKRIAKGGDEVWLQGSFNPILDKRGRPCKVVQYATNITAQCREAQMNRTVELAVEREIQVIVSAFNHGDLKKRIPLEGKNGFHESL